MIRKAAITAVLLVGVTFTAPRTAPVYGRLISSAQTFHRHFQELGVAGNSLSPIERFFFSLALTSTRTPERVCAPRPVQPT